MHRANHKQNYYSNAKHTKWTNRIRWNEKCYFIAMNCNAFKCKCIFNMISEWNGMIKKKNQMEKTDKNAFRNHFFFLFSFSVYFQRNVAPNVYMVETHFNNFASHNKHKQEK